MGGRATPWAIAVSLIVASATSGAAEADGQEAQGAFAQALRDGSFALAARYRYELVDQANFSADANASTLRTRLTYTSAAFRDFSLLLEMDDVRPVLAHSFNSTRNGNSGRPVVADPKGTELNQGFIRYTGLRETEIEFGRQRINHLNQRFVGSVGWRQNEQTMDALEVNHSFSPVLQASYTHVSNVNRVFGPSSGVPAGDLRSSSHFLTVSYDLADPIILTGYSYFLDFDNAASLTSRTVGARLQGTSEFNEQVSVSYVAEYARQGDHGNNPVDYDAEYYFLEAGLNVSSNSVKLGYEVLEGDGRMGHAFTTPLATLHAFQGWADMFLVTPANGIEDIYVSFTRPLGEADFTVVYHDFSPDTGGGSYGDEIDLSVGWSFDRNTSLLLKMASYSSSGFAADTDKFWIMLSASF